MDNSSRLKELISTSAFPRKKIIIAIIFTRGWWWWWWSQTLLLLVRWNHKSGFARPTIQTLVHTTRWLWSHHRFLLYKTLTGSSTATSTRNYQPNCTKSKNIVELMMIKKIIIIRKERKKRMQEETKKKKEINKTFKMVS